MKFRLNKDNSKIKIEAILFKIIILRVIVEINKTTSNKMLQETKKNLNLANR